MPHIIKRHSIFYCCALYIGNPMQILLQLLTTLTVWISFFPIYSLVLDSGLLVVFFTHWFPCFRFWPLGRCHTYNSFINHHLPTPLPPPSPNISLLLSFVDLQRAWWIGPRREKTYLRGFANNTGADQPAHPRSLISVFVIRVLERTILKLAASQISFF